MKNNTGHDSKARRIPLRDFFRNPEKTEFRISPDGKYVSYLAPFKNRLNVYVQKAVPGEPAKRVTNITERDIHDYFWKNNDHIIYLKDNKGDENFHLFSVDKDGNNDKELTPFPGIRVNLVDELEDKDNEMLISMNKRNLQVFDVYRLNIETGELKLEAENPGNVSLWLTDHDGKIRIAITADGVNHSYLYRENENDAFRTVLTTNFREQMSPVFFTFDNKYTYSISNIGRDQAAFVKYDIANGKELELIYENPDVDVSKVSYSKKRKLLTILSYVTSMRFRVFFDDETKRIYERLEKEFGKYDFGIIDMNKNEDVMLVYTYSDRSRGTYYLYDKTNDTIAKLADDSPWINENEMSEQKPVQYTSRDGLVINGYLSLPIGVEPKNLPFVVHPHGGPWVRDYWGYDPEVQFLTNRGYAVFQMNYRGSVGYGRRFWESSFKQWGKTMQDDITDGVRWLINEGIADPKRIAIYGASYGGYAVLAGLTFTPEVYCCGVDYVGVSNLFTFMKSIPEYWKPYLEMLYEMVGNPEIDKTLMEAASPIFHVDKIKAPLLIAQGRMDPRVNVNESDQMVEALRKRGIDVPYIVKDNEGHGFNNEENRFDFYEAMEKFLEKHL